jgi:tetratricopeptide (TPR) repeat protein
MPYRAAVILLSSALAAAAPKSPARPRYVSSQAYYHAMRAEIALSQNDLTTATGELQLALVYDSDSPYLTLKLAWANLKLGALQKAEKLADRTLVLDPKSADAWLVKSRAELARGQPAQSEKSLKRALDLDPASIDAAIDLARIYQKTNRTKDAISALERSAEKAPDATEPLAEIAEIEVARNHLPAAAQALERALTRDPKSTPLAAALTPIYERQARYQDAAKRWRDLLELSPGDPDALFYAARAELWVDRDNEADRDVEAIQSMLRGPDIDEKLGFLYLTEGRHEKAIPLLLEAVRAKPSDQRLRFAYAIALAEVGKDEAALAELEIIGKDHELYVEARVRIAQVLLNQGRFDRALAALRAALEHQPYAPPLVSLLAETQARSGHIDDALRAVREAKRALQAAKDSQGEAELTETEAQLLVRSGDRDRGIRLIRAMVDQGGGEDALYRLASIEERAGDLDAAQEIAQKLLKESPDSARALNFLGYLWADRAVHLDEAVKLLRRAISMEPRSGALLDSLGWAYHRLGRNDEAERFIQRALHLVGRDPEVAEHLGDVLAVKGNKEGARSAYDKSLTALERAKRARDPEADKIRARVERKRMELARKKP